MEKEFFISCLLVVAIATNAYQNSHIKLDIKTKRIKAVYLMPDGDSFIKFPYNKRQENTPPGNGISDDLVAMEDEPKNLQAFKESLKKELADEENLFEAAKKNENKALKTEEILENPEDLSFIAKAGIFGEGGPTVNEHGDMIVEGDIAMPPPETGDILSGKKATRNALVLWPGKTVPYSFATSVSDGTRSIIMDGIKHWEDNTCIKFRKRNFLDPWYVNFRTDMSGCWSYIGNILLTLRGQDVSIGKGCEYKDTVIHELGHAIGFFHEQARSDRDRFVRVLPNNIQSGMQSQFSRQIDQSFDTDYDVGSIMQYFAMAFSKEPFKKNTLVSMNPHHQRLMGKHNGLSFRDRKIANTLYNCNADCPNRNNMTCQNGGYMGPYKGDNTLCLCDCPPGTSGDQCENSEGEYYAPPMCGGNVTEESTISTPDYPTRSKPFMDCSWWIQAPEGKRTQVEFLGFSFAGRRETDPYKGLCTNERVEIRTTDIYDGDMYCATDIKPGTVMTSTGRDFVILITANGAMQGEGLHAKITFV